MQKGKIQTRDFLYFMQQFTVGFESSRARETALETEN
jgi:hypothetical protein